MGRLYKFIALFFVLLLCSVFMAGISLAARTGLVDVSVSLLENQETSFIAYFDIDDQESVPLREFIVSLDDGISRRSTCVFQPDGTTLGPVSGTNNLCNSLGITYNLDPLYLAALKFDGELYAIDPLAVPVPAGGYACVDREIGDINADGWIDGDDLDLIAAFIFQITTPSLEEQCAADTTEDGVIDANDYVFFNIIFTYFGSGQGYTGDSAFTHTSRPYGEFSYTITLKSPVVNEDLEQSLAFETHLENGAYVRSYTATSDVIIENNAPELSLVADSQAAVGNAAHFSLDVLGGDLPIAYHWDFGDGTEEETGQGTVENTHSYSLAGTYVVTVTATDVDGDMATATGQIEILDLPVVELFSDIQQGIAPLDVAFTATVTGADGQRLSYQWDFGDGNTLLTPLASVTHTYHAWGDFTATVTVTDVFDRTVQDTISLVVHQPAPDTFPSVTLGANPQSGTVPLLVDFTADVIDGNAPFTYIWDFGDGSDAQTTDVPTISHTFGSVGAYVATVTVSDEQGDTDSSAVQIVVAPATQAPSIEIMANADEGVAPLTIQFASVLFGGEPQVTYLWSFGDGSTSQEMHPEHTFSQAGTYTVSLTVLDVYGRSSTDSLVITVAAPPADTEPVATAFAGVTCGNTPLQTQFTGTVSGGEAPFVYHWDFGDGTESTEQNPTHFYLTAGTYTATFTISDADGDTDEATVFVTSETPGNLVLESLGPDKTQGDASLRVAFSPQVTGGNCALTYTWDFGDGKTSSAQAPFHTFTKPGTYKVTLTVEDADGSHAHGEVFITVTEKVVESQESTDLSILRMSIDGMDEPVDAGDTIKISLTMENYGEDDFEDLRIVAIIPELGERMSGNNFDVGSDDRKTESVYLQIPPNTPPGEYDIRIFVGNDDFRRVKYRTINVA